MSDDDLLCPSGRCTEGAMLLGTVEPDRTVAFLDEPPVVDRDFVSVARLGRRAESRFRFATPCVRGACANWDGRCGVAAQFTSVEKAPLPRCAIRARCRWFAQRGPSACAECRFVITDSLHPDQGKDM